MDGNETTASRANEPVPRAAPIGWIHAVLTHAPELTRIWGRYLAFVAVITIVTIVALIFIRNEALLALVIVVLAALWSPLAAKWLNVD
jgi:hypothetical protein